MPLLHTTDLLYKKCSLVYLPYEWKHLIYFIYFVIICSIIGLVEWTELDRGIEGLEGGTRTEQ